MPLAVPIAAFVCAGIYIFGLSRVLLAVPEEVATPIALACALALLIIASFVASRYDDPAEVAEPPSRQAHQ